MSKEGFTYSTAFTDDFFEAVFVYFFKNKWDTERALENLFDCSPYDPTEEMAADIFTRPATYRIIDLWPSRFRCRRHLFWLVCIRKTQMAFAHVHLLNKENRQVPIAVVFTLLLLFVFLIVLAIHVSSL